MQIWNFRVKCQYSANGDITTAQKKIATSCQARQERIGRSAPHLCWFLWFYGPAYYWEELGQHKTKCTQRYRITIAISQKMRLFEDEQDASHQKEYLQMTEQCASLQWWRKGLHAPLSYMPQAWHPVACIPLLAQEIVAWLPQSNSPKGLKSPTSHCKWRMWVFFWQNPWHGRPGQNVNYNI